MGYQHGPEKIWLEIQGVLFHLFGNLFEDQQNRCNHVKLLSFPSPALSPSAFFTAASLRMQSVRKSCQWKKMVFHVQLHLLSWVAWKRWQSTSYCRFWWGVLYLSEASQITGFRPHACVSRIEIAKKGCSRHLCLSEKPGPQNGFLGQLVTVNDMWHPLK